MRQSEKKACEIWAFGSGKGGTGKSFMISSVGTKLASRGNKVVLIDADLGGANLHSFLGMSRPKSHLNEFFERKMALSNLIVNTGMDGLSLITGDLDSMDSDNIKYSQKMKFFRHIMALDTDYILIDLGAGSNYKTLDIFLLADKMIVIVLPQLIAIENMYHFVKNVVFRKIALALKVNGYKNVIHQTWKKRGEYGIANLRELIDHLRGASPDIEAIINRELSGFCLNIILNQVRTKKEIMIGANIRSIFMKQFGLNTQFIGFVEYDDSVMRCLERRETYVRAFPHAPSAQEIGIVTETLVNSNGVNSERGSTCPQKAITDTLISSRSLPTQPSLRSEVRISA
jgi:flagellar biosynthesis protein FlhG